MCARGIMQNRLNCAHHCIFANVLLKQWVMIVFRIYCITCRIFLLLLHWFLRLLFPCKFQNKKAVCRQKASILTVQLLLSMKLEPLSVIDAVKIRKVNKILEYLPIKVTCTILLFGTITYLIQNVCFQWLCLQRMVSY